MLETEPIELVGTLNVGVVARGTKNYNELINKPVVNGVELEGTLESADLGLQPAGSYVENETDPIFSASPSAEITSQDITNWNNKSEFSGNYNDLTNKPDLSQFITKSVNDLTNYYLKSETYTKNEVNLLIGAIQQFHYEIVQELPQTGATNILYLVPKSDTEISNVYDEYVYANNNWEKIGDTQIDLSDYVTTSDLNTALASYTTTSDLTTLLAGKEDISNKVTSIDSSSTNIQYPSAKSVYDALQDIGSGSVFLGSLTDFSSSTPLDLNKLDVGMYFINVPHQTSWNTRLYMKATVNNVEVVGNYRFAGSNLYMLYDYIVLYVKTKVEDMTFSGSNYNDFGTIKWEFRGTTTGNKEVFFYVNQVRISTNDISVSNVSTTNFSPVELSGNQTISGVKTFNSLPQSSVTPTNDNDLVNKKYVDDLVGDISTVLESLVTVSGGE